MARLSRQMVPRGPSPIFKRRQISFTSLVANSNPTEVAQIILKETCTVYAMKVNVLGYSVTPSGGDIQETMVFVRCAEPAGISTIPNPTGVDASETETANGFYVGSLWTGQHNPTAGGTQEHTGAGAGFIRDKYRYRRKCDRNTVLQLYADSIVREGTARSVRVVGFVEFILRIR